MNERLLFISNQGYLGDSEGGVQWCTKEYVNTLRYSGFRILFQAYQPRRDLIAKIARRLWPRPFSDVVPINFTSRVVRLAEDKGIHWIALNNSEAAAFAVPLRQRLPNVRILLLSHGAEIIDELNLNRLHSSLLPRSRRSPSWLGKVLLSEVAQRQAIDAVLCISDEDVLFERWLGSSHILFLPRQITPMPVPHRPIRGRVGTVSTLNHTPNRHGIELLARHLKGSEVELRIVGTPELIGKSLQASFPCIHYCGSLSGKDLEDEVSTWNAFVNPVFCQARGASTKVATALAWGLPVLSTPQGIRGYIWDRDLLPVAESPQQMATLLQRLINHDDPTKGFEAAQRLRSLAPSSSEVVARLQAFLQRFKASNADTSLTDKPDRSSTRSLD